MTVEILDIVQATLDHSRIGSGRRLFVVLQANGRKVRLLDCGKLRTITVPIKTFRGGLPIKAVGVEPVRLAARLDRTRLLLRRHGVAHAGAAVRQIVAALREQAP